MKKGRAKRTQNMSWDLASNLYLASTLQLLLSKHSTLGSEVMVFYGISF